MSQGPAQGDHTCFQAESNGSTAGNSRKGVQQLQPNHGADMTHQDMVGRGLTQAGRAVAVHVCCSLQSLWCKNYTFDFRTHSRSSRYRQLLPC
jgi:hypothetical protein